MPPTRKRGTAVKRSGASSSSSSATRPPGAVVARIKSDVILCIKPGFVDLIATGKKNY
ncbi:MAG: hypothetical protein M1832_005699 [Thelocarpon impressellum]|nr:MAG: hypothetical protein M1832_005699 [Thelocarpon impressellum]